MPSLPAVSSRSRRSFWQLSCLMGAALWLSLARTLTPLWLVPLWTEEDSMMGGALSAPNGISRANGLARWRLLTHKADPRRPEHSPDISPSRPQQEAKLSNMIRGRAATIGITVTSGLGWILFGYDLGMLGASKFLLSSTNTMRSVDCGRRDQ